MSKDKQVTRGFAHPGISKATQWVCKKCEHVNKDGFECKQCGHEPMLGRRDFEAQRWNDSHRKEP